MPPSPACVAPLMKLRLTQSKCGSRQGGDELFLQAFHLRGAGARLVVEPLKMEEPVNNVETQLVPDGGSEFSGLSFCGFGADHDLTVLEGDDVGRTGLVHEPAMQFRDPSVGDKDHVHLGRSFQLARFAAGNFQTLVQRAHREVAQRREMETNQPLTIIDADLGPHDSGRVSAWKFRVINRAPLLKVT